MSFFPLPVQAQPFSLAGSGAIIGDTTITLKSFLNIDGSNIIMSDFGTEGYLTLEPGNNTLEEQVSFTGVTQNSNGTATLTGIKSVLFITPFTETSGLAKTHAGSTAVVISNTAGFYAAIKGYIDTAVSAGAVPATTTVNGIGHVSVTPSDAANPIFVGTNDIRVPTADPTTLFAPLETPTAGIVSPYAGRSAPTGWLLCDGTAVSRSTYSLLFSTICPSTTFTVTIASPAVFTKTGHGLVVGDAISLTTTGGLPSGLSAGVQYYVISGGLTANAFEVALSPGGTAVVTSGSQSGVHTYYATVWGLGNGSTTFNVPDLRSKSILGLGQGTETLKWESGAVDTGADTITIPNYTFPSQGQPVILTTTGVLPAGLSLATTYYVIRVSSTTISFATTQANSNIGTAINLTDTGSGVGTMTFTNVNRTVLGLMGGEETHGLSANESSSGVSVTLTTVNNNSGATPGVFLANTNTSTSQTGGYAKTSGGDTQHNVTNPFINLNFIIKT